ncbi:MAG TPA: helix-turn-helix domain-containing protein [Nocardioidaceae bacterium]|nr:helix-turn-helix domain-containing protein [Nocardioidaceae bacterium]
MPLTSRRVQDAAALKALAHPLRVALLGALVTEGPMTATQAAELLDESPSNCSWHLRKLAEHGFVREARGSGSGRNRPWQAVSEGLEWGDPDDADASSEPDAATRMAGDALTDVLLERELQRFRAARAERDREPKQWREATGLVQSAMWMTAEETAQARQEIQEVLMRYGDRYADHDRRPEGARLISMVAWLVPFGPHRGRGGAGRVARS